jgi:hypothetical protein
MCCIIGCRLGIEFLRNEDVTYPYTERFKHLCASQRGYLPLSADKLHTRRCLAQRCLKRSVLRY